MTVSNAPTPKPSAVACTSLGPINTGKATGRPVADAASWHSGREVSGVLKTSGKRVDISRSPSSWGMLASSVCVRQLPHASIDVEGSETSSRVSPWNNHSLARSAWPMRW